MILNRCEQVFILNCTFINHWRVFKWMKRRHRSKINEDEIKVSPAVYSLYVFC